MAEKKRIFSIDFCCVIGIILMLGFHFFQRSGIQEVPVGSGVSGVALHTLRWLCMAGYPLVLMLSGAAFLREDFSYSQYKGLFKIAYCIAIGYFAVKYLGGAAVGAVNSSVTFYYYGGVEFAELYAFILLASPFLNCAYQGLPNKKARFALIAVMSVITSVPNMLIINDTRILANIFSGFYPVTLYFIGAYVYDNRENSDMLSSFVMLVSMCLAQAIFSYTDTQGNGGVFICERLDSYSSLGVIVSAGAIFSMFCNINVKSEKIKCVFRELARCAMIIIMLCGYAENKVLNDLLAQMEDFSYIKYFLPYLGIIVVLMFAGGFVFMLPFSLIRMIILKNREEQFDEEYEREDFGAEDYEASQDDYSEKFSAIEDTKYNKQVADVQPEFNYEPETKFKLQAEEEVELTPRTEREYPVENKPKPLKKKTPATFESVMTEYTNDYHSTTPPDDVDKLIELIMSGK